MSDRLNVSIDDIKPIITLCNYQEFCSQLISSQNSWCENLDNKTLSQHHWSIIFMNYMLLLKSKRKMFTQQVESISKGEYIHILQSTENVGVWTEFGPIFWEQNDIGAIWVVLKFSTDFESNSKWENRKKNRFGIKSSLSNEFSEKDGCTRRREI